MELQMQITELCITRYSSLDEMTPSLRRSVSQMRYPDGDFRHLVLKTPEYDYKLISCIVATAPDGTPVGWSCYYRSKSIYAKRPCVGFWVRTKYRNRGIGKALIEQAHKNWARYNPKTFDAIPQIWDTLSKKKKQKQKKRNKS